MTAGDGFATLGNADQLAQSGAAPPLNNYYIGPY
jgi:hypothetical protein